MIASLGCNFCLLALGISSFASDNCLLARIVSSFARIVSLFADTVSLFAYSACWLVEPMAFSSRLLAVCALVLWTIPVRAQTITISAAASLQDVLRELARDYKTVRPRATVRFNFGGSGTLARQIERGAPVDAFIAAGDEPVQSLVASRLLDASTRRVLAENRLVLIVPTLSRSVIRSFGDVANDKVRLVAIGIPETVPAGARAREVFTKLGVWPRVNRKAVRARDVREALTQVELGNVDAGVVYATDARGSNRVRVRVRVVAVAPTSFHRPIRYPMLVVSASRNKAAAREFLGFLAGARARSVLRRAGFIVR